MWATWRCPTTRCSTRPSATRCRRCSRSSVVSRIFPIIATWKPSASTPPAGPVMRACACASSQSWQDTSRSGDDDDSMNRVQQVRAAAAAALALATCACNAPKQVSGSGFGAYEVSLAAWDDGLAIGWYDTRDGNAEIYVRMLDADKSMQGGELRMTYTAADSYEADLATLGDDLAIAWYEKSADTKLSAQLGLFERGGKTLWQRTLGARGNTRNPVVRAFGGALFCAWI